MVFFILVSIVDLHCLNCLFIINLVILQLYYMSVNKVINDYKTNVVFTKIYGRNLKQKFITIYRNQ